MSFELKISPKASEDIDGIYDFIYKDSPKNALEQVRLIYKAFDSITEMPGIGANLRGYVSSPTEYKFFVINKTYITFYLVKNNAVYISRVFSVKQDYLDILGIK